MIQLLICLCFLVMAMPEREYIFIQYSNFNQDQDQQTKYIHRIREGYFVELGGYNPIGLSNTVSLANWKGVIVQANQERANMIRDYQVSGVTSLNFALTNESGTIVTFYQVQSKVMSSTNKDVASLSQKPVKQQKVMTINLADLCHKYYRRKPTFMSLDLQGTGQSVIRTNDWSNSKCIPDIIDAEDNFVSVKAGQTSIKQYLIDHNYTHVGGSQGNKLFIHNTVLQFYKNEAKANLQYLKRPRIRHSWMTFYDTIFRKLIGKSFDAYNYSPREAPAYVHIRQPTVYNIAEINNHSNFISDVGLNRPIIILQYDQQFSSFHIGSKHYIVSEVKIDGFLFKKIQTLQADKELLVYVLDHQKYDTFNLVIDDSPENISSMSSVSELQTKIEYVIIVTLVLTNALLFGLYAMFKHFWQKKNIRYQLSSNQLESQSMSTQERT